jgi:ribosomal-protein-serine acetyltransferase
MNQASHFKEQQKKRYHTMEHIQIDPNLRLESAGLMHAPVIFQAIDRDRQYLREWLPFVDSTQKITDTEAFITSLIPKKDDIFTIWHTEEFAGLIGFKDTDWINHKTEIGYWLTEKKQGKGIVTKCMHKLIRYAFQKLKLNRIQIKVACGNEKSAAIPRRLGFHFEGTERQGERHDNRYLDLEVFSLLKSDWLTALKTPGL